MSISLKPVNWSVISLALIGCSHQPPMKSTEPLTSHSDASSAPTNLPAKTPELSPSPRLLEQLNLAHAAVDAGKRDDARRMIEVLRQVESLTAEEQAEIAEIEAAWAALNEQETEAERNSFLQQVDGQIASGQLDEATVSLDAAAARKPTEAQADQIQSHRRQIDRIRGAQRKLSTSMKLLGSTKRSDVRAAQTALTSEPEAALPLLLAALRAPGEQQRTVNVLDTLRQLRMPSATLPAMVGVLERSNQRDVWPDVVETLNRMADDGAGLPLLKLVASSQDADQRTAALTALSNVPDPPAETVITLLPKLFDDGADLPAALICASQAMRRHHQIDFIGLHGFPENSSPDQLRRLSQLPSRLETLRSSPEANIARSARMLSVILGLVTPEPLPNVQVLNVSAEYPDGQGQAVLDGVWQSTELKTMWYHPVSGDSQLVLDLGEDRTVTGVVLWNFNQAGGAFRGWKRAEVFVSPTPTALDPVTEGIVPMAPGAMDPLDYGTVISVPCVQGRYVKLKAKELWNANAYTGLAEVQVLGF